MRRFPEPISNLVAAFCRLPGVGPKTALRYVFYLLRIPKTDVRQFAQNLIDLSDKILVCDTCFTYTESERCLICQDLKRDPTKICVVEESRDISTIEATDAFNGHYHVLGGNLNPIEGMTEDSIRIRELVKRLESQPDVHEILLALSPTVHGETTMLYLTKKLAPLGKHITRLARGLPIGATLEYADEITLGDAIKDRKTV